MNKMGITLLTVIFWVWLAIPAVVHASGGCKPTVTPTAPDSRYTDNSDGTVTDLITGLMWKQCSEGQSTTSTSCDTDSAASYTWQLALQQAETINGGGGFASYTDWRLPNRNELLSLVEFKCHSPAINTTLFPNTPDTGSAQYWSSSPYFNNKVSAWRVVFSVGTVTTDWKGNPHNVRLVRGGL